MSPDARLELARELERADDEVAAVLGEVDELAASCEALRGRAVELDVFLSRLPAEREASSRAAAGAAEELDTAEAAAREAARGLAEAEAAGDGERLAAARRFEVRARGAARLAARRVAETRAAVEELESRAARAAEEIPSLEARARELAAGLRERPRLAEAGEEPTPGPAAVSAWAAGARATLLVARTALASERDAVIRQANELGALVLGEPLTAAGAAVVARRVERELGG